MINEIQQQQTEEGNIYDRTVSRPAGILYSLVLFGSAALILLLFEDAINVHIYVVYMIVGLILSLSIILMMHLFLKKL